MVLIDYKGYFKVRKVQFRPLLSIWANMSETVHAVTNVCMKYIYKVIYDLSVDLVTFDLGLPVPKVKVVGHRKVFLVISQRRIVIESRDWCQNVGVININNFCIWHFGLWPIVYKIDFGWHWKVKSRSLGINLAVYHRQLDIISVA